MKNLIKKTEEYFDKHSAMELFIVFLACCLLTYLFNRNIEYRSLYMDDLRNYYDYPRMSFWQYAFGVAEGQVHYRPVFYAALYGICALITGHVGRVLIINGLLQAIIGTEIYYVMTRLKISRILSILMSALCLSSHLSYFQMGQMIGPIESLSMIFAIWILYTSIRWICADTKSAKNKKTKRVILITYFLVCMTHERYFGLIIPIAAAMLMKDDTRKEKITDLIQLAAVALIVIAIRYAALHSFIPVGTSKTDVTETFSLVQAIGQAFSQLLFVLGFNVGPEYLTGIEFADCSSAAKAVLILSAVLMILVAVCYLICKIFSRKMQSPALQYDDRGIQHDRSPRDIYGTDFRIDLIIILSIMMYIASSSVTIRLEMRWIYISFIVTMIYGAYMITYICKTDAAIQIIRKQNSCSQDTRSQATSREVTRNRTPQRVILLVCTVGFLLTRFAGELYYRKYYPNIFFFKDMIATNSLADQTVGKYDMSKLRNCKVYLAGGNTFELDGWFFWNFYEPLTGELNEGDEKLIELLPEDISPEEVSADDIVLIEDPATHTFLER